MSDVPEIIREIAEKIGTTAEAAWPLYVQYTYADALAPCLVVGGLFAFVLVLASALWVTAYRGKSLDTEVRLALALAPGLVLTLLAIVCAICLSTNLPAVIAPEGAAIHHVIQRVVR